MSVHATALTTLDNFKASIQVASADTSNDTLFEQYIDRATQWIEGATERKLKARNYNGFNASGEGSDFDHKTTSTGHAVPSEDFLYFDGDRADQDEAGRGVYYLPQFPVLKVSGSNRNVINHPNALTFRLQYLASRGSTVSGNETWTSLTEFDDYVVEYEAGVIRLVGGVFTPGLRNYRVKCTAGLIGPTANTQPYTPPDLELLCIAVAKRMYRDEAGLQSESIGTWSRSYNREQQDKFIDATLARYRRFSVF